MPYIKIEEKNNDWIHICIYEEKIVADHDQSSVWASAIYFTAKFQKKDFSNRNKVELGESGVKQV